MDKVDYIGSFAQENVNFATQVIRTATVGDNFYKAMLFLEKSRFIDDTDWEAVPGCTKGQKVLVTNASNYAADTDGLAKSWLFDLFVNGFAGDCILVSLGVDVDTDATAAIDSLKEVYEQLKPYAYFKTACVCTGTKGGEDNTRLAVDFCVELAALCADEKNLLSAAPAYPFTVLKDAAGLKTNLSTDYDLYKALNAAGTKGDAYMVAHMDATRNGALYNIGLALSTSNASGLPIGNGVDMVASANITCGGVDGIVLPRAFRSVLKGANIGSYKFVGDNTGSVACEGEKTLCGDTVPANWILCYINYMCRVNIAKLLTQMNTYRNATTYSQILSLLSDQLMVFSLSGRLTDVAITAPAYDQLPSSKTEFVITHAWVATYVGRIEKVSITGSLYV